VSTKFNYDKIHTNLTIITRERQKKNLEEKVYFLHKIQFYGQRREMIW
jgi:hypothetical protein